MGRAFDTSIDEANQKNVKQQRLSSIHWYILMATLVSMHLLHTTQS